MSNKENDMSHPTRRTMLIAAGASLLAAPAFAAFPERPIKLVVPYGGGGMGSAFGAMVAEVLASELKAQAFADYKPGANAAIGTELVAKAPPDGYTLLMATTSSMAINPAFYPELKYDSVKDFTPVGIVWISRNVLYASKAKTVKELVEMGKKKPLTYGSAGAGTLAHLSSEMLVRDAGIKAVHLPFKGQGAVMSEVASGRLDFAFTDPTGMGMATSGRVNALAVTGKDRLKSAPNVPTMAEAGYPNVGTASWIAIFAPANTPKDVVEKISHALSNGFSSDAIKTKVAATGAEVAPDMSPQTLDKELKTELARWKKFQQDTKITIGQ
jgi:tripartite-type tricarboxylate transporter receptor subunit TctC